MFFCQDARGKLLAENPGLGPAEVQKKREWGCCFSGLGAPHIVVHPQVNYTKTGIMIKPNLRFFCRCLSVWGCKTGVGEVVLLPLGFGGLAHGTT